MPKARPSRRWWSMAWLRPAIIPAQLWTQQIQMLERRLLMTWLLMISMLVASENGSISLSQGQTSRHQNMYGGVEVTDPDRNKIVRSNRQREKMRNMSINLVKEIACDLLATRNCAVNEGIMYSHFSSVEIVVTEMIFTVKLWSRHLSRVSTVRLNRTPSCFHWSKQLLIDLILLCSSLPFSNNPWSTRSIRSSIESHHRRRRFRHHPVISH